MLQKIEQVAGCMKTLGVAKGDVISIQALTMPETVILFYATVKKLLALIWFLKLQKPIFLYDLWAICATESA